MANTFKVVTKAGVTSEDVIYTVAGSTTTVVLGIMLGNTTTSQVTATVTLSSNTSNRALDSSSAVCVCLRMSQIILLNLGLNY